MESISNDISKLAFLFLMVSDSKATGVWKQFFSKANSTHFTRYCHTKTVPTDSFWKSCHTPRRIPTRWGDISLVKATLLLLQTAYENPTNQYFILLSDSCLPIVDFKCLRHHLVTCGKSWVHYKRIDNRITRYQQLDAGLKNKLPWSKFYSQHQWMVLTRQHVKLVLQMSPTYLPYFRRVHAVDEHYIVSLLYLAGVLSGECHNHRITYCDWSDKQVSHPATFTHVTDKLVEQAQSAGNFFLRKVAPGCKIGNYLRYILR